jgi:hypothetical protein
MILLVENRKQSTKKLTGTIKKFKEGKEGGVKKKEGKKEGGKKGGREEGEKKEGPGILTRAWYGLNCVPLPQKRFAGVLDPVPHNVTLFGDKVFIKVNFIKWK